MSREVRERIASDLQIVAADPSLAARLIQTGQVLRYIPPIEYPAGIDQDREKLAAMAKALRSGGNPRCIRELNLRPLSDQSGAKGRSPRWGLCGPLSQSGGKQGGTPALQRAPDMEVAEAVCCIDRHKFYTKPFD
jgi:hypothetical protein